MICVVNQLVVTKFCKYYTHKHGNTSNHWNGKTLCYVYEMARTFSCFSFCIVLISLELVQSQLHLDGRAGLQVGVLVQGNRISYENLAVDKFHRLQVSIGSSTVVNNYRECALSCVNNTQCLSFNVASSPRTDKKFRCELLFMSKLSTLLG